jgi:hypothetical protein
MRQLELGLAKFAREIEGAAEVIADAAKLGLHDALDEWQREARDLAPLSKRGGTLRRGIDTDVTEEGNDIVGEISATAIEVASKGKWAGKRFNYAYYLHEEYPKETGRKSFKNPTIPGTIPEFIEQPAVFLEDKWMRDIENEIETEMKRRGW